MNMNIIKPNKEKLTSFVAIGGFFALIGLLDVLTNTFLEWNFTGFLPGNFSFFAPLICTQILRMLKPPRRKI